MKKPTKIAQALSRLISGRVSDSSDAAYRQAIQIDNGRIAHQPTLVVAPDSADDVAKTLSFCAKQKIKFTVKSGGHSAAGYCLNTGGIVIDLRRLNAISLDRATGRLKVGMGCRWREVYDFMENSRTGMIPIGGGCSGVGVGGFLLGGGYSFLSRSYGLGCDNMKSMELVTADGKRNVAHAKDKDPKLANLFWASCGAGGGNFGIGVEVELQLHKPKYRSMMMGEIAFPFYQIDQLLPFYNDWVETLTPAMDVYGRIANSSDPRAGGAKMLTLLFTPIFNGSFAQGVALLQPLIKQRPIRAELHQMTIAEWENYIGSKTSVGGRSAYIRSLVIPPGGLDAAAARVMMKYMARCPSPDTFMVWTHAGGKISDVKSSTTAFPHRKARFIPELKALWDTTNPDEMRKNVEWAYDFFEELSACADGAYANYIDPLLSDWAEKYYGSNYNRLLKVKKEWDPKNVFSFQQGIGSSFEPSNKKPLDLSPLHST